MTEKMQGHKLRTRSQSFGDFTSQAKLFYDSQTPVEQQHIKDSFTFELSKVEVAAIRQRQVELLMLANQDLANEVAQNLGIKLPKKPNVAPSPDTPENDVVPKNRATPVAAADSDELSWTPKVKLPLKSAALSQIGTFDLTPETRKVAFLITSKSDFKDVETKKSALEAEGLVVELVVPRVATLAIGKEYPEAEKAINGQPSHAYDAVWVMTSADGYEKPQDLGLAIRFIGQAFKHCKSIAATAAGAALVDRATFGMHKDDAGVFILGEQAGLDVRKKSKKDKPTQSLDISNQDLTSTFIESIAGHRHWERELMAKELPY